MLEVGKVYVPKSTSLQNNVDLKTEFIHVHVTILGKYICVTACDNLGD